GRQVVERLVAQDAGVVDHDVDAAERVERALHDRGAALGRGDAVGVGHRLAAERLDLADDLRGRAGGGAGPGDGTAEIVDDDTRSPGRELERVGPPEASTGSRDDRNLAVESELRHVVDTSAPIVVLTRKG